MGKGDKKTKKGKITLGTFGVRRPKKANKQTIKPKAKNKVTAAAKAKKAKPVAPTTKAKEKKVEKVVTIEKIEKSTASATAGKISPADKPTAKEKGKEK